MNNNTFPQRLTALREKHAALLARPHGVNLLWDNGRFTRWQNPVVTAAHVPLEWRCCKALALIPSR